MARAHRRAQRTRDRATRSGGRPESRVSARITARPARRRAVVDTGPAAVWGSRAGSGDDLPDRRGSREQCPSTAMCYKMHLEAVEAISQISTVYQRQRYIEPLLHGEMFAAAPVGSRMARRGTIGPRPRQGLHLAARDRRPPDRPCAQIVRDLGGPPRTMSCSVGSRAGEPRGRRNS